MLGCGFDGGSLVARVADRVLSVDRLAELMVLAQPVPVTEEVAQELAGHWVHLMAFGRRMATGDSLLDSATVLDVMRYRVQQEIVAAWRRQLLARSSVMGDSRATARFDSTFARELLHRRAAALSRDAVSTVRQIAANPWDRFQPERTVASFAGGTVTAPELARYVQHLSPATRQEMGGAPDSRITDFLWGFVLQTLLTAQAESAGVRLGPVAFQDIQRQYRDAVHALWQHTGLSPASLASAARAETEREQAAGLRVEEYLDAAAARRVPLQGVPPFLAVAVLGAVDWEIRPDRMSDVVRRAQRLLAATEEAR